MGQPFSSVNKSVSDLFLAASGSEPSPELPFSLSTVLPDNPSVDGA